MRTITGNIMASHRIRAKTLGDLVKEVGRSLADTRSMIERTVVARKAMGAEQAAELAGFTGELTNSMGAKLKGFQKELDRLGGDRVSSARALKGRLRKEAGELRQSVKTMLTDFHEGHADMSAATRSHLRGFAKTIVKAVGDLTTATQGMMSGHRAECRKAGDLWGDMTRTLAKAGGKRVARPVIRAEEEDGPAKKAVHKVQKKRTTATPHTDKAVAV
ncbi:MAG: hypothetical protein HY343_12945 [Lentisphaerae bacterium]|nr:hypothetical protein [Lentisphaerota bacterium]